MDGQTGGQADRQIRVVDKLEIDGQANRKLEQERSLSSKRVL